METGACDMGPVRQGDSAPGTGIHTFTHSPGKDRNPETGAQREKRSKTWHLRERQDPKETETQT